MAGRDTESVVFLFLRYGRRVVVGDQPLAVLPLIHVGVACTDLLAVGKLERIGADVLGHIAADLDDALVNRALRLALEELDEVATGILAEPAPTYVACRK